MGKDFKVTPAMKKQQLIDEYERLLDAYKKQVKEAAEAEEALSEAEAQAIDRASQVAQETTVEGVIANLGNLRGQINTTINALTDRMTAQAERLESLNRAIGVQEKRLQELHEIEAAADSFSKLVRVYDERRAAAEAEHVTRLEAMEEDRAARLEKLESQLTERRESQHGALESERTAQEEELAARREELEAEISAAEADWSRRRAEAEHELADKAEERKRAREREEAEYVYERDRQRKLEEHGHEERKEALEKGLREKTESAEKELEQRAAAIASKEDQLAELRREVAAFPEKLRGAVEEASVDARVAATRDAEQKAELAAVQRKWESKVSEEKIKHLQENIDARDDKLIELKAQLDAALAQVQHIAEKTVEGASLSKAFQTVNDIALEQARRPDASSKD